MTSRPHALMTRWFGALLAGLLFAVGLLILAVLYTQGKAVNPFIKLGFHNAVMMKFAAKTLLCEVLPLYLGSGFFLYVIGMLLCRIGLTDLEGWKAWRGSHAFWSTLGFLMLAHALLWWRVPTAMWVIPGLRSLPLAMALILVFAAPVALFWKGLAWSSSAWWRKSLLIAVWSGLVYGYLLIPAWMAQAGLRAPEGPPQHPARVLMISLDGLRQDTALDEGFRTFQGYRLEQAYAAIPATRLEWAILWGGEPRHYSVGNVMPSVQEYEGDYPFQILEAGKKAGLKARFYIDDGGTIGLADRESAFDRVLMPARGWENFLNSNLAAHIPLYGIWLDALRVFPTTTPWTPLDLGLRKALEDGRGADWVMYHSCLAHQPIYLDRSELKAIPGWWRFPADRLQPLVHWPTDEDARRWRPQFSPYLAYRIRIASILQAWERVWRALPSDPNYGSALRICMTDHGERFYHLTEDIQMGGLHGFGLDPWELRIPIVFDGPGIPQGTDAAHAVSLLTVRNLVAQRFLKDAPFKVGDLTAADYAPMRMQAIDLFIQNPEDNEFKQLSTSDIIEGSRVLPGGVWVMKYKQPESVREEELTFGEARGNHLTIWRPLKVGGGRQFDYDGYTLAGTKDIPESDFLRIRNRVFTAFSTPWNGSARMSPR